MYYNVFNIRDVGKTKWIGKIMDNMHFYACLLLLYETSGKQILGSDVIFEAPRESPFGSES